MANEDLKDQFEGGEEVQTDAVVTAEEAASEARDTRVWEVDGVQVTKSEFIRHQFTTNNLSRKEISEQFDIAYRTVYGATMNMTNDAEPTTRGRSASNMKILVSGAGQVITQIEGVYHLDNAAVTDEEGAAAASDAVEVDRNTWIKEQVANGRERGDIARALGLSYGVIYNITKEAEGTKQRYEIEYNGEVITRSEYIRRRFAEGIEKAAIAKELGVDYPVVWSALKGTKTEAEKYAELVDKLAKFVEKVATDAAIFNKLIDELRAVEFKADDADESAEDEQPVDSVYQDEAAE